MSEVIHLFIWSRKKKRNGLFQKLLKQKESRLLVFAK